MQVLQRVLFPRRKSIAAQRNTKTSTAKNYRNIACFKRGAALVQEVKKQAHQQGLPLLCILHTQALLHQDLWKT